MITLTELKLMAAAAKMGLSRIPKNGAEDAGGERHSERVVDEGKEKILADVPHGRLAKLAGAQNAGEVAFDQRDAATLHGDIGAGPHGDADVGLRERRGVIDNRLPPWRRLFPVGCSLRMTSSFPSGRTSASNSINAECRDAIVSAALLWLSPVSMTDGRRPAAWRSLQRGKGLELIRKFERRIPTTMLPTYWPSVTMATVVAPIVLNGAQSPT